MLDTTRLHPNVSIDWLQNFATLLPHRSAKFIGILHSLCCCHQCFSKALLCIRLSAYVPRVLPIVVVLIWSLRQLRFPQKFQSVLCSSLLSIFRNVLRSTLLHQIKAAQISSRYKAFKKSDFWLVYFHWPLGHKTKWEKLHKLGLSSLVFIHEFYTADPETS